MNGAAHPDLPQEVAVNRRYLQALSERLGRPVGYTPLASERWVARVPQPSAAMPFGPLVARVRLDVVDEDLGEAFYIGARWLSDFDHPVVSWAAPVAAVYFDPDESPHELAAHVAVRRTLLDRSNDIAEVFDVVDRPMGGPLFPSVGLSVPAAPRGDGPRRRRVTTESPATDEASPARGEDVAPQTASSAAPIELPTAAPQVEPTGDAPEPVNRDLRHAHLFTGMRSPDAVQAALLRPRGEALQSVLATLQPDQYQLVTANHAEPTMIQGHPGTGKTIIAVHRAAYLVAPREEGRIVDHVLLLGPTEDWVRHVSGMVGALDPEQRVTVRSTTAWWRELSGLPKAGKAGAGPAALDVGRFVADLLLQAARACQAHGHWKTGPGALALNSERVYECLRAGRIGATKLRLGPLSREWIPSLPPFQVALPQRRLAPVFAFIGLITGHGAGPRFGHIVVDESQDIGNLEWEIVKQRSPERSWTLVGDMNQRRSDFTHSTWDSLASAELGEGFVAAHRTIERGYRSTQAILDFAKPLLPRTERTAQSVQGRGLVPTVIYKRRPQERDAQAVLEAERLHAAHAPGSVAIICLPEMTVGLEGALLDQGWRRRDRTGTWGRADGLITLSTPDSARGIEFDGVVVVEPGDFPLNIGRIGALYTSLTRANKELAVVHSGLLPDPLRRHGRR